MAESESSKQPEHTYLIQIPGLKLLNAGPNSPTIMSLPQNTSASVPASAEKVPGGLVGLEDWLKANPVEPDRSTQTKKEKTKPAVIAPIAAEKELLETNWIGRLFEYWAPLPEKGAIDEGQLDTPAPFLYHCTITISESPTPFGGPSFPFLNKKHAKQHAAKQAVEYLIQTGRIKNDIKKAKMSGSPAVSTPSIPIEDQSLPAQVQSLAHKLGFKSPSYDIKLVPGTEAFFSGHAKFVDEPLIEGNVGEVHNVWSKKAAKDQCVREVLDFLRGIERHRQEVGEREAGVGEKRKLVGLESPEKKAEAKVSKYDGSDEEEGTSEYGTPEPIA